MNNEELIIEKLNDIKEDQRELKNEIKNDQIELKNDFNKRIDHLEEDLTNIKDNHLTHIYEKIDEQTKDIQ